MCGRYASSRRTLDMIEQFEVEEDEVPPPDPQAPGRPPGEPNYNIAPTARVPVVLERVPRTTDPADQADDPAAAPRAVRRLRALTWGLVPSWAKDATGGARMINARAESLLEKPAFRRAAVARRCLVPADGWYEWQASPTERDAKGKPRKQPFFIQLDSRRPLAFAGIYEFWREPQRDPDDETAWLSTFSIITAAAEPGLDVIHDRMPLVLPEDSWADWLDPEIRDPDAVRAMLLPAPAGRFTAQAVSTRVNAVVNNDPQLLEPLDVADLRGVVDPATGELIGGGEEPLF